MEGQPTHSPLGNPTGPNISERFCTIFVPIFIFSAVQFYPARRLDPAPIFREPDNAPLYRTGNGPVLVPERRRAVLALRKLHRFCTISAPPDILRPVQFSVSVPNRISPSSDLDHDFGKEEAQ